mmetsp:Transcript_36325/g.95173  ORF Transcript_36325/g.95173 Transcript_36325/m.95173 type:complete len:426 (-) Transcript_36325:111-1388(-)
MAHCTQGTLQLVMLRIWWLAHCWVSHRCRVGALAWLLHVVHLGIHATLERDGDGPLRALPTRRPALKLHYRVLVPVRTLESLPRAKIMCPAALTLLRFVKWTHRVRILSTLALNALPVGFGPLAGFAIVHIQLLVEFLNLFSQVVHLAIGVRPCCPRRVCGGDQHVDIVRIRWLLSVETWVGLFEFGLDVGVQRQLKRLIVHAVLRLVDGTVAIAVKNVLSLFARHLAIAICIKLCLEWDFVQGDDPVVVVINVFKKSGLGGLFPLGPSDLPFRIGRLLGHRLRLFGLRLGLCRGVPLRLGRLKLRAERVHFTRLFGHERLRRRNHCLALLAAFLLALPGKGTCLTKGSASLFARVAARSRCPLISGITAVAHAIVDGNRSDVGGLVPFVCAEESGRGACGCSGLIAPVRAVTVVVVNVGKGNCR